MDNLLRKAGFNDDDLHRVSSILAEDKICDLQTLKEATESDLRSSGLKGGDIIKLRRVLCLKPSENTCESQGSSSSNLNSTLEDNIVLPKENKPNCACYTKEELLSICPKGKKCTPAQQYFRILLRNCAKQSKIWHKAYTIATIPDDKLVKFFELMNTAAPVLLNSRREVIKRLGAALQNTRKYRNDIAAGKRKIKLKTRNNNGNKSEVDNGEKVVVYMTDAKKKSLGKAIYLGPSDPKDEQGIYSLLQLLQINKCIEKKIALPAQTAKGVTTFNKLQANDIFIWKTIRILKNTECKNKDLGESKPPKKKTKTSCTSILVGNTTQSKGCDCSPKKYNNTLPQLPIGPSIKSHDGKDIELTSWVGVAYDDEYFIGQVTNFVSLDYVKINFLRKVAKDELSYKWPKQKDVATIHTNYIFVTDLKMILTEGGKYTLLDDSVGEQYKVYKETYM